MTTAFVLSGGGSRGSIQVVMLLGLAEAGITPGLIVGTSVGAPPTAGGEQHTGAARGGAGRDRGAGAAQCSSSTGIDVGYFNTLTARATTSAVVDTATIDCTVIIVLAQRDSGMVSVGENATTLV